MLTTEEALAVAVLKGDTDAAQVLADLICEKAVDRVKEVKPQSFKLVQSGQYKAIVYLKDLPALDYDDHQRFHLHLRDVIQAWIESESGFVMVLPEFVDRVQIFEIIPRDQG